MTGDPLQSGSIHELDPRFGTQNAKHAFLLEEVGLSESEYLTCLNDGQYKLWRTLEVSRRPGAPMARVYLGHWRWLQQQGPSYKQAASRKLQASSRKLDKGPVPCYSVLQNKGERIMNTKEAWALVGGLSKPSKMPGWSIGIPPAECKTGGKLVNDTGLSL